MIFGKENDLFERLWNNKLIKGCLVSALVWFFFRYLFSLAAPFFLAFALITLLYPPVLLSAGRAVWLGGGAD